MNTLDWVQFRARTRAHLRVCRDYTSCGRPIPPEPHNSGTDPLEIKAIPCAYCQAHARAAAAVTKHNSPSPLEKEPGREAGP